MTRRVRKPQGMATIITLTTDFGTRDSYVAQMQGTILRIAPDVRLVDVTHDIPPQDIVRAALVLREIVESFPAGTIHLAVVDPGVGSARRLVAAEMANQRFVGPDNGLFGLIAREHPPPRIARLEIEQVLRDNAALANCSHTFHGRDVLAPAAARWSLGCSLEQLGTLSDEPLQDVPLPRARLENNTWQGEVIAVDRFGNAMTNIHGRNLSPSANERWTFEIGRHTLRGLRRFYAEVPSGEPLALIGSAGWLEMAVNCGNAATLLNAVVGTPVVARCEV